MRIFMRCDFIKNNLTLTVCSVGALYEVSSETFRQSQMGRIITPFEFGSLCANRFVVWGLGALLFRCGFSILKRCVQMADRFTTTIEGTNPEKTPKKNLRETWKSAIKKAIEQAPVKGAMGQAKEKK